MKTFIAAIVLLAITAALIVSNEIFVNRATDKMLSLCDVFPADVGDFDERYEEISTAAEKIRMTETGKTGKTGTSSS